MNTPYSQQENPQAWTAWQCLCRTHANIFLTGKAGTGKTTFLRNLKKSGLKQMVVTAPTGVAAVNAGGATIHSFFQLSFGVLLPGQSLRNERKMRKEKLKVIRGMNLLVIDEVSMVRADLLDAIDARLREVRRTRVPFGGVQLLLIGDLYQLPPVLTDNEADMLRPFYDTTHFFGSRALQQTALYTIELKKIYRQSDLQFIDLLNKVRNNTLDNASLALLNSRYNPSFNPPDNRQYIRLTTHNAQAESINSLKLAQIDGRLHTYSCSIKGSFPEKSYPAESSLGLKAGAQVMFLKNDKESEKRYFNGKIGRVVAAEKKRVVVTCDDEFGSITVEAEEWENISYETDPQTGEIKTKVEGVFSQIPLCLAWAITIHKSQGLTFDRAIIDAGRAFSAGQVYVALSRCRTFEGLTLSSPIHGSAVMTDSAVNRFLASQEEQFPSLQNIETLAAEYALQTMEELFDFHQLTIYLHKMLRLLEENYRKTYPKAIAAIGEKLSRTEQEIMAPAAKYLIICRGKASEEADITADEALMRRTQRGARYFDEKLTELIDTMMTDTEIEIENKALNRQFNDYRTTAAEALILHHAALQAVMSDGFSIEVVQKAKNKVLQQQNRKEEKVSGRQRKGQSGRTADIETKTRKGKEATAAEMGEAENIELYAALRKWRDEKAEELDAPLYLIASNLVLTSIANAMPTSKKELRGLPGIGTKKAQSYGDEWLEIVKRHKK